MSARYYLPILRKMSGLNRKNLGKEIGLKSISHISLLESGVRLPNIETCKKIIEFAKKYKLKITLDMLRGDKIKTVNEEMYNLNKAHD